MCNRARYDGEPETLWGSAAKLFSERPRDNRFNPKELRPKSRNYVVREQDGDRFWDVMTWDVLGGQAPWPMTNVRKLALPQWRTLAAKPENRCVVPLTEFAEFTPDSMISATASRLSKGRCGSALPTSLSSRSPASGSAPPRVRASRWSHAIPTAWSRRSTPRR